MPYRSNELANVRLKEAIDNVIDRLRHIAQDEFQRLAQRETNARGRVVEIHVDIKLGYELSLHELPAPALAREATEKLPDNIKRCPQCKVLRTAESIRVGSGVCRTCWLYPPSYERMTK